MVDKKTRKSDTKELFCAPDRRTNKTTCYTKDDLLFLVSSYNNKRPSNKHINLTQPKHDLWKELNNRLKHECESEWCWLEQNFIPAPFARKMMNETFRPEKPKEWDKNPFEWLTTTDIRKVMKQYEKRYPSFLFIGPVPVDCPSAITCPLSNLNVKLLVERMGKTKLGIVFNLDPHNKPGSHWVGLFSDFQKGKIFYFDSVGMPPPKPIRSFLDKLKEEIETYHQLVFNTNKNIKILINRTRFQYGSSECGLFSMYFIISNLTGSGLQKMNKSIVNDKKMNELRNIYYRP